MDVVEWLSQDMSRVIPESEFIRPSMPKATTTTTIDQLLSTSARDAATARYLSLPGGTQDYGLNQLAWSLTACGLDEDEIRDVLDDCARQSHSPSDRAKQVNRVMQHFTRLRRAA